MRLVMIESPFAATDPSQQELYLAYARRCVLDSLGRGEAPFAMHLLYPQVLDDSVKLERALGLAAGMSWLAKADFVALYNDYGVSPGMQLADQNATRMNKGSVYRSIGKEG